MWIAGKGRKRDGVDIMTVFCFATLEMHALALVNSDVISRLAFLIVSNSGAVLDLSSSISYLDGREEL